MAIPSTIGGHGTGSDLGSDNEQDNEDHRRNGLSEGHADTTDPTLLGQSGGSALTSSDLPKQGIPELAYVKETPSKVEISR